jgi:hypothetical protein
MKLSLRRVCAHHLVVLTLGSCSLTTSLADLGLDVRFGKATEQSLSLRLPNNIDNWKRTVEGRR